VKWFKKKVESHAVKLTGQLSARVFRGKRNFLGIKKWENLGIIARKKVTVAFANYLVASLQNQTTSPIDAFKYHDSGIGTNGEANTDTALQTPTGDARVTGTQVQGASANIYRSIGTITYAVAKAVTEHGLFSAATTGTLMDRSVFAVINMGVGEKIEFTYELTVQAEA
jgi:hypothetical protein